jgi:hypothetical protein
MDRISIWLLLVLVNLFFFFQCEDQNNKEIENVAQSPGLDSNQASIEFFVELDKTIYQKTNFGDPPQLAIWIENQDSSIIKSVWVSRRTAKQEWKGKIECLVSLPYWGHRLKIIKDHSTEYTSIDSDIDAVSQATPTEGHVKASISVPKKSKWIYYIEVNVSADYNKAFTYWSEDGLPDSEANGQPSIVYKGRIIADGESHSIPNLIGRTSQRQAVKKLSTELSGITTAKYLIRNLEVKSIWESNKIKAIQP